MEKTLTLRGEVYQVRELTMEEVLPMFEGDSDMNSFDIAKMAISKNGQPMGDEFLQLPFPVAQKLLNAATELNKPIEDDSEGNA